MNRLVFVIISIFFVIIYNSCSKTNDASTHCPCSDRNIHADEDWWNNPQGWKAFQNDFVGIENISFENYPKVDGSTSANVLNMMVACRLLNVRYAWWGGGGIDEWGVSPLGNDIPEEFTDFFWNGNIKTSQTHGAFMNLIDGVVDIILTHRTVSSDEKAHADHVGVKLIETSIASDAFVFVINQNNTVSSLTVDQIRKIYTGKITDWEQVGGRKASIEIYSRPRNSGSEEVFRELVMDGLESADFPPYEIISPMWEVLRVAAMQENAICYTFNNYKDVIARRPCNEVPVLAVNGICPEEKTINNKTYPFRSEVRVAIRSDLDHNSMAYKLYEWLQSENAKSTIEACGFFAK